MKTLLVILLSALSLCVSALPGNAQDKPAVLLIARGEASPGGERALKTDIDKEANTIIDRLHALGYAVDVASESGNPIQAGGSELKVNMKLSDVQVQRYIGVIIPCMAQPHDTIPPEAVKILQEAKNTNIPVAAQQSGVEILGAAGLLKGRNYAVGESAQEFDSNLKDGIFKGVGVVQDGNIVTSGICPWLAEYHAGQLKDGTEELVVTFVGLLKK